MIRIYVCIMLAKRHPTQPLQRANETKAWGTLTCNIWHRKYNEGFKMAQRAGVQKPEKSGESFCPGTPLFSLNEAPSYASLSPIRVTHRWRGRLMSPGITRRCFCVSERHYFSFRTSGYVAITHKLLLCLGYSKCEVFDAAPLVLYLVRVENLPVVHVVYVVRQPSTLDRNDAFYPWKPSSSHEGCRSATTTANPRWKDRASRASTSRPGNVGLQQTCTVPFA